MPLPPKAMILAAGFGTRLGELTQVLPKPMLPVCGTPLVRWCVLWLRAHGIREIAINLHHLGDTIQAELGDGSKLGVDIAYSPEGTILGTGGGLRQARPLLDDGSNRPIVVLNGKLLFDLDLERLLAFHRDQRAEATMVLRGDAERSWGGNFAINEHGRITTFLDQTSQSHATSEPLMFTGIHVLTPRFLDRIPDEGEQCVIRTAYTALFREAGALAGFLHTDYWWEHSTIPRYLKGIANVLDGKARLGHAERPTSGVDPGATVEPGAHVQGPVWIGPSATIEAGARVGPYVQVGEGARVTRNCELCRVAVWPGATVRSSAQDTVIAS